MKRCKRCGETKPLDEFYAHAGCRDGVRPECKACNLEEKARRHREHPEPARQRTRSWHAIPENRERTRQRHEQYKQDGRKAITNRRSYLKRKYGITLEDYDALLEAQGGVCDICGREPRSDISLHVDHDHATGAIRGLLCFRCNVAIGLISEDHANLAAIGSYFDAHDPVAAEHQALVRARVAALPRPAWE